VKTVVLIFCGLFIAIGIWKFVRVMWHPESWRSRNSSATNNWQNEGYMAHEDGWSWSEIDGTIENDVPPVRIGTGNGGVF
jgi:hypothetical protein